MVNMLIINDVTIHYPPNDEVGLLGNFQLLCLHFRYYQIWSSNIHNHHGNPAHIHLHVWIRVDFTDPVMDAVCIQQGLDYAREVDVLPGILKVPATKHLLALGFRSPFLSAAIFQGCAYDRGRCCLHVMCRAAQPITATVELCQTALAYIPYVDGNREALSPSETGRILQSHKKFCPQHQGWKKWGPFMVKRQEMEVFQRPYTWAPWCPVYG